MTCFYCSEPVCGGASFRDGRMVAVCDDHMARHLARAEAHTEADRMEQDARSACEEAYRELGAAERKVRAATDMGREAVEARSRARSL